ncbi:FkbM family methyltransferase [Spirosoma gilvum]
MSNVATAIKAAFSSFGVFLARKYPNQVNGLKLEDDLRQVIRQPNPLCFDVGANQGQTIQLLQQCFANPVIHAFEPASKTFNALTSQSFGPNVSLHQLAFGEQAGTAEFRNYEQSELSSFLAVNPDKSENIFFGEQVASVESVTVETLDSFCAAQGIAKIDLLKIDTQGFELPVLRGATRLLTEKRIGALLLELNFAPIYEGQSDPLVILNLLREHDMRLVDYYEKERMTGRELSWTSALFVQGAKRG